MDPEKAITRFSLLSVVIPAYNAEDTLGEQLNALRAQDYAGDWEVLVVNNRSCDGTVRVVQEYQRLMPNLYLVSAMEKQGRAYACNVGVRAARGDALIFCDADDVVAPGWLAALAEALQSYDVVAGKIDVDKLNRTVPWRPSPFSSVKNPILGFLPYFPGANCALLRRCFESVGGFSEEIPIFSPCEDIDLAWRLQLRGYTLHDAPRAVMYIRYRDTAGRLWKQMVSYAEAHAFLYKRFSAYGMPRSSFRIVLHRYLKLVKQIPQLYAATPKKKFYWLSEAACCWGHFKGSLRLRTLYL